MDRGILVPLFWQSPFHSDACRDIWETRRNSKMWRLNTIFDHICVMVFPFYHIPAMPRCTLQVNHAHQQPVVVTILEMVPSDCHMHAVSWKLMSFYHCIKKKYSQLFTRNIINLKQVKRISESPSVLFLSFFVFYPGKLFGSCYKTPQIIKVSSMSSIRPKNRI